MPNNFNVWLHGLAAAFVSGGASAVTGGISASAFAPDQFNLGTKLLHTLGLMGMMFAINGILGAMFYLKQSPVPAVQETTVVTASVTTATVKEDASK